MKGPADDFITRVDAVTDRLANLARLDTEERTTDPDLDTGERWEAAQVWSHIVEFLPYWREQIDRIREADSEKPIPFGRIKTDPDRIARIEQGRTVPMPELWDGAQEELAHVRGYVAELTPEDWARHGRHPKLGVMDMPWIIDRFLVEHLEEHAEQLESLTNPLPPATG
ncbi:MAG TPA: DinB family protein [Actinomycetota bacterium]|nr:DinB family protein [Actinomycetota bacterium]